MMILAQSTEQLWTVAGMQAILLAVQMGSLIWKKKGEADPGLVALKEEIAGIGVEIAAFREQLRLAAAALVVAEQLIKTVESALRLSSAKELAEINSRAHETRLGLANVLNTLESDRLHFNEVIHELRKVIEEIRHAVWGDGVPGLKQDQRTSEMKIDHMKEDIDRMKGEK